MTGDHFALRLLALSALLALTAEVSGAGSPRAKPELPARGAAGPSTHVVGRLSPALPIGVDMPHLLLSYLGRAPVDAGGAAHAMDLARARGLTHARFIASGFWPVEMSTGNGWLADPHAYFAAFDALIADARARGLHLVPSLLWNVYLFPDLAGEPAGRLFTPGSASRTLAERYVTDVVTRYKDEPAILFWEIGNELNLPADLDVSDCTVCGGATNGCANLAPALGTPCARSRADDYFSCDSCRGATPGPQQDLRALTAAMAGLIHAIDSRHAVSSGDSFPRSAAHHLSTTPCPPCDFTADSEDEYAAVIANLHPDGVNVVSVHHPDIDGARFGDRDPNAVALIERTAAVAHGLGKALYVGEFGEKRAGSVSCGGESESCGGDPSRTDTHRVLDALVESRTDWAALWAYEFYQVCDGVPTCDTVTDGEEILDAFPVHNAAYAACEGAPEGAPCPIGRCAGGVCAPVESASFPLETVEDVAAWSVSTECTGCTPGELSFVAEANGGYARVSSHDLPCNPGSGCTEAGVRALSPEAAVPAGHAILTVDARASVSGAEADLIAEGAGGTELGRFPAAIRSGGDFQTAAVQAALPSGTTAVRVQVWLPAANATLDLDWARVVWEP